MTYTQVSEIRVLFNVPYMTGLRNEGRAKNMSVYQVFVCQEFPQNMLSIGSKNF